MKKNRVVSKRIRRRRPVGNDRRERFLLVWEGVKEKIKSLLVDRRKLAFGLLGAVVLLAFVFVNKSLLVVALVNGRPITRFSFEQRVVSRYGQETVDELVNEELVRQEASKRKVAVASREVTDKISQIEMSLEGKVSLEDVLASQRVLPREFRRQVELQLLVEKILAGVVLVSDQETRDYVERNRETMKGTTAAELGEEARKVLLSQKRTEEFRKFFDELKKRAKVIFLL